MKINREKSEYDRWKATEQDDHSQKEIESADHDFYRSGYYMSTGCPTTLDK
jgi:hypothetical protein